MQKMLTLTRKAGEKIIIGDNEVVLVVSNILSNQVSLNFYTDTSVSVHRDEIYRSIKKGERGEKTIIRFKGKKVFDKSAADSRPFMYES